MHHCRSADLHLVLGSETFINSSEDGRVERYINVRNLSASDRQLTGAWRMFEFNRDDGRLLRLVVPKAVVGLVRAGSLPTL